MKHWQHRMGMAEAMGTFANRQQLLYLLENPIPIAIFGPIEVPSILLHNNLAVPNHLLMPKMLIETTLIRYQIDYLK